MGAVITGANRVRRSGRGLRPARPRQQRLQPPWAAQDETSWGAAWAAHHETGQQQLEAWVSDDAKLAYEKFVFAADRITLDHERVKCHNGACGAYLGNRQFACRWCGIYIKGCWGCGLCKMVSPPWNEVCWYNKNGGCAGRYEGAVRFDVDAKGPYQETGLRIRDAAAARTNTLTIATAPTSTALVPYTPQYPVAGGRNGKGGGQGGKGGKGGKGRGPN